MQDVTRAFSALTVGALALALAQVGCSSSSDQVAGPATDGAPDEAAVTVPDAGDATTSDAGEVDATLDDGAAGGWRGRLRAPRRATARLPMRR